MRAIVVASIAVFGWFAQAAAADLPVKAPVYKASVIDPPANWTGFYVGANAGYAWGHSDASTAATCGAAAPFYFSCGNQAAVQGSGTGALSPRGFTGGVQAGYNWQVNSLVYGAEADFGALSLKASRAGTSAYVVLVPGVPFTTTSTVKSDWLLTVRGRLGWTVAPNVLLYGTGGLAVTDLKVTNTFADALPAPFTGVGAGSNSATKAGWTAGGGVEWMLTRNWTAKAEYLYVDFGSVSATANVLAPAFPAFTSQLTTTSDLTAHIARAGVNYKF